MSTEIISNPEQALALTKAEIDIQIATAKKYPRSLESFKEKSLAMINTSPEVAAGCNYYLTRAGKTIKGPSIRMAEIIQNNWGNMRTGAKVIDDTGDFIIVQGACHDLESNVAVTVEVKRRVTDKKGKRYNADMIQTTTAAAISIAIRNAVFKVIPNVYTMTLAEHAEKVAQGTDKSFPELVKQWFEYFVGMGISEDRILQKLNLEKKTQVSKAHLTILSGIGTALRDNMTTIETEFPTPLKEPEAAEPQGERRDGEKSAEDLVAGGQDDFLDGVDNGNPAQ